MKIQNSSIKTGCFLLLLCMVLLLLPMQVFADDPLPVISIDASMENTENDDYEVVDDAINLSRDDVVYELTGETDRKIQIWGSNSPDPAKTYYLRLNGTSIHGGITIYNSYGAKIVIEVADGTVNTLKRAYAVDLTITGKGTLYASDLGVTQQNNSDKRLISALYIKDTTINVTTTSNSSQWNGTCVLDGEADITYTTATDYAPLALGQTYSFAHSLTMKGNSRLHCLHSNADAPSDSAVDGLSGYNGTIRLQDNAYLEAQGRAGSGEYVGCGIICDGDITVADHATIKATAQGSAICAYGNLEVTGGSLEVNSTGSNALYVEGKTSIKNATGELKGYYPTIWSNGDLAVENSALTVTSTADCALYSPGGTITITDSKMNANGSDGYHGIRADSGVKVTGSWIETTGSETFQAAPDSIANSVLFNGSEGKVIGEASIPRDATVAENMTLEIPEETSLIITESRTLTNNGTIHVKGDIKRLGTINCNSHIGGTATCTEQAVCDVCEAKYGTASGHDWGEPVYTWAADASTCTAGRTCKKDATHTEKETVDAQRVITQEKSCTLDELSTVTATFTNPAFAVQTKEGVVTAQKLEHKSTLKYFPAKAATKDAEGNIEYWYCESCKKYFADAAATKEITQADTVTKKLTEDEKNFQDGNVSQSGSNSQSGSAAQDAKAPQTGDMGNRSLWIALLLLSGGAAAGIMAGNRRKNNR